MDGTNQAIAYAMKKLAQELHAGGEPGKGTWVLDTTPGHDLLGVMASLSAEQASQAPIGGKPTIAGVCEHMRFGIEYANHQIRHDGLKMDWADSWNVTTVDDAQWAALQDAVREQYDAMMAFIDGNEDWSDKDAVTDIFGIIAHTSYHLGAVKQMMKQMRLSV